MPDGTFERAAKRSKSDNYANSFAASTNYFCGEVGDIQVAISPLASHEGWWEKPSVEFARMREGLGCRWGVVLVALGKSKVNGFWISGPDFEDLFRYHSKIHSDDVERAERRGQAHRFDDFPKFVELLSK